MLTEFQRKLIWVIVKLEEGRKKHGPDFAKHTIAAAYEILRQESHENMPKDNISH